MLPQAPHSHATQATASSKPAGHHHINPTVLGTAARATTATASYSCPGAAKHAHPAPDRAPSELRRLRPGPFHSIGGSHALHHSCCWRYVPSNSALLLLLLLLLNLPLLLPHLSHLLLLLLPQEQLLLLLELLEFLLLVPCCGIPTVLSLLLLPPPPRTLAMNRITSEDASVDKVSASSIVRVVKKKN